MSDDLWAELRSATESIISSASARKLVVAGPGAGKTFLFKELLRTRGYHQHEALLLTFINNLKDDLATQLSDFAAVYTFHGFCLHLLRRHEALRDGLGEQCHYFPQLPSLVKRDWEVLRGDEAPSFVRLMREVAADDRLNFYRDRARYYDATDHDHCVYTLYQQLLSHLELVPTYELILVDEYQDFNALEAGCINLLAQSSPVLIAGDDDQALYSQLRNSDPAFIRQLHDDPDFDAFRLPFCMRCTEAVVAVFDSVVLRAQERGNLNGRIAKVFRYFPPKKGPDSERYPKVRVVWTSVQSNPANYMGKYLSHAIGQIPPEEIAESYEEGYPTALVIGPRQYLGQVRRHLLEDNGVVVEPQQARPSMTITRDDAFGILKAEPRANLGWRIILEVDSPKGASDLVRQTITDGDPLSDLVPEGYRDRVLGEAAAFTPEPSQESLLPEAEVDNTKPLIKLTSYEGSKGLSAQHVFVVGLHNGDLPNRPDAVTDLEVCKFLVALTRTRKQCHIVHTSRFAGQPKRPSVFLDWLPAEWCEHVRVNKNGIFGS